MIVSIDPGRKSGVAVFDDEPGPIDHIGLHGFYLHSWRLVKMLPSEAHGRVALSILREIGVGIGDIVVVEEQWIAPSGSRRSNPKSVQTLMEIRYAWQHAAEMLGATVHAARSDQWMREIASQVPGDTPGERVRWVVGEVFGKRLSLDEAAAVGIGLWWIRKNR